MKIEEFGVVYDDFLLWLEKEKSIKNIGFFDILETKNMSEYIAEYFFTRTNELIDFNAKMLEKRIGREIEVKR